NGGAYRRRYFGHFRSNARHQEADALTCTATAATGLFQGLRERRVAGLSIRIVCVPIHEPADAPHSRGLLCPRCERPRGCAAADKRDELAPSNAGHGASLPTGRRLTALSACHTEIGKPP